MVRCLRWLFWACAVALMLFAAMVVYDSNGAPISTLMVADRVAGKPVNREVVPLKDVSPRLVAAVLMSEDAQFCSHDGVDWDALHAVMANPDGPNRGASTITMQTAKNLFLWPGRSYLRKALEIPMALALDAMWSKRAILGAYLNVAEWGDGVFGAEAASRLYFNKPASKLDAREAALLASALPNPRIRNPVHPTRLQRQHVATIMARMTTAEPWVTCVR